MKNNFLIKPSKLIAAIFLIPFLSVPLLHLQAQKRGIPEPVMIDSAFNLYRTGMIYLSGQPDQEEFESIAEKGITLIINIRTAGEMEKFDEDHFDEAAFVKGLNIEYLNTGVGGPDGYKPEVIDRIAAGIKKSKGPVLIHCGSAGRATMVWMAWLVRTGQCSIDEAIRLGKKARYSTPFEDLLGFPVTEKKSK